MISLATVFYLMIAFFGLIGALRGWTREVIATAGLVLSLFAINQFGPSLVSMLGSPPDPSVVVGADLRRQQYYILALTHLAIAFFSYQGPKLARTLSDRLRVRESLQDMVMGTLVGMLNGYLIIGALWSFLELQVGQGGYTSLPPGVDYPFASTILMRPGVGTIPALTLISKLPLPLLAPYLPFLVVLVFLFVIVVMI